MTGIFKANNPSGNVILFMYAIFLKLPMFFDAQLPYVQASDGIMYKTILNFLAPIAKSFPLIYSLLAFILLFLQAVGFNKIANTQKLHKQTNYLTGMGFLLITSLFSDWFILSAPLIVNTLMVWIWARLSALYNNNSPKATIFNIGFATGLSAFIYFPSIAFLLLVMVGIGIARPFKMQEWLLGLIGIITPVYFFACLLYLTNQSNIFDFPSFHITLPGSLSNRWTYLSILLVVLVTGLGLLYTLSYMRRQVVQTRKSWQLLFLYIIVAAIVPFINADKNFTYWILFALPLSPLIASAFYYPKKKYIPIILHWSMAGLYVFANFLL